MKKYISKIVLVFCLIMLVSLPFVSMAQFAVPDQGGGRSTVADAPAGLSCLERFENDKNLGGLFTYGTCLIVATIVPLLFAIALAVFLWGVVQFLMNADDQEKQAKGKQFMIWGIIALAVMFSVWGLVGILRDTFGVTNSAIPKLPV